MYLSFLNKLKVKIRPEDSAEAIFLKDRYSLHVNGSDLPDDEGDLLFEVVGKIAAKDLNQVDGQALVGAGGLYVLDRNQKKLNLDFERKMTVEQGLDVGLLDKIFGSWVLVNLVKKDIVPIHASSVRYKNKGILLSGQGGAGKTRMMLKWLDNGAQFVCDEWTLLFDNNLFPLKDKIELCDYDMRAFPKYAKLNVLDRVRAWLNRFSHLQGIGPLLRKWRLSLASKIFNVHDIFNLPLARATFNQAILLQRSSGDQLSQGPINNAGLVDQMWDSFSHEQEVFFYYFGLYRKVFPSVEDIVAELSERYQRLLTASLDGINRTLLLVPRNFNYQALQVDQLA